MGEVFRNLDYSVLTNALLNLIPALICIPLHELCHGLVALWLGDDTAKRAGRLSMNPLKHIDLIGLICMAAFRFGWAKPVPINMNRFKRPRQGMALTALAGPISNLIISIVFLAMWGFLLPLLTNNGAGEFILGILQRTAIISLSLCLFNLIPISPLDGSKILYSFLPDNAYRFLMRYERYGMLIMAALLLTGVLSGPLNGAVSYCLNHLLVIAEFFYKLGFHLLA
ncbi:MAG: site-2 protease family protein [Oscillospiraceae bacterium]|nr:site-2 protease family protein [Oscillospiraceae bacterium]